MKNIYRISFFFFLINLNFFAANYYWVGGTGNWTDLSHWATTSGGATFYSVLPTANDNVIFDALSFSGSGQSVSLNGSSVKCDNMNWSGAAFNPTFLGNSTDTVNVYGSLIFNVTMTNNALGHFYFWSSAANDSIKTNGQSLKRSAFFNGSGTYNLRSAFTCSDTLNLLRGTLNTNGYKVICKKFNSTSTITRALNLAASTVSITGVGTAWNVSSTGLTFTPGTSKIIFNTNSSSIVSFNSGGVTVNYNVVDFQCSEAKIIDAGTFDSLLISGGTSVTLPNSKTQFLNMLVANGTCGSPITIKSDGTTAATISKTNATNITCNYLKLSLITKSGAGTFTANNSIIEVAPCANWVVNAPGSATTYYWINGNGKWSDVLHWSTTSGGAAGTCIPGPGDNVVFNTSSGFASNDSVIIDKSSYCNNMTWTGALPNPRLAGTGTKLEIKGSLTFVGSMSAPFTGDYKFVGTSTQTITTAGVVLNGNSYFNGLAGQWQLGGAFTSNKNMIIQSGHLNTVNNNVSCFNFISTSGTGRQLTLGSSVFTITGYNNGWQITAPFTLNAGTSEIILSNATSDVVNFKGAALTYNHLTLNNKYTSITTANIFKRVKIAAGNVVTLESGITQTMDSLLCNGTCAKPITIEASSNYGPAANISKTGYTVTAVAYVNFKNVTASTATPVRVYNASNSTSQYTTTGWTITGALAGGKRYWISGTGDWSDNAHWSLISGGAPTTCIPNSLDTVIFDANSFSGTGQVVNVDVDGYCRVMDWTGAGFNPKLFLIRNVIVKRKATLNAAMQIERYNKNVQLQFLPNGNNVDFDSKKALINTDVLFEGQNGTDSLKLLNHMYLSDSASFSMIRGTLITNGDSIKAGAMSFFNIYPKTTRLGSSYINLKYGWNSFTNNTMVLNSGTSTINIDGSVSFDYFYGDNLTYNNVSIASPSDTNTFISGSNVFTNLTIKAGVEAKITAATTQTITNNFIADGNCKDSIRIESTVSGSSVTIYKPSGTATTRCLILKDVTRTGGSIFNTLFSTNKGNVTGWTFIATPPTTASFTTNTNLCLGAVSNFTSTSTSYLNDPLVFSWAFGDGDSSLLANPTHTYVTGGKKYITLTTTYTVSNCKSTHKDSIVVNAPFVTISSTESDTTICAGSIITFSATGGTGALFQFNVNGTPQGTYTTTPTFSSSTITNGQVVTANTSLNGCLASSAQSYTVKVNPLPNVLLNSSDADNIICTGTPVSLTASGAHKYQFYVNGVSQGFATTTNTFSNASIVNGQTITVTGSDTITGCIKTSAPRTFTVNTYPTPTMTCSTSNVICAGTSVAFNAAGSGLYEFFVNGVSQGAPAATSTFSINTLANSDVVTLTGTSNGCSASSVNSFSFTVNAIPTITVANNATGNAICNGESVTYTAGGATLYQFFVNGVLQTGPPSGSNTFVSSTLTNGQVVSVGGTGNGCVGTVSATPIIVNPSPTVGLISSDADNTICLNDNISFTANGATTYEFFINSASQGAPTTSSVFTTTAIANGQDVTVKGYSAAGCGANGNTNFTFTVLPLPSVNFYSSITTNTICEGQSIAYTALGTTNYEFFINGVSQGAASSVNTFTASSLAIGTSTIKVLGFNSNGCSAYSTTMFTVTVIPIPVITLTSSDADNMICDGAAVSFSASGASLYQFYLNGVSQGLASAVSVYTTTSLTNGQVVSVSGSQNGCSNVGTSSYTIAVNPQPSISLNSSDIDNIICQGQSVTYTASGAANYEFFINGVSQGAASSTAVFTPTSLATSDVISVNGITLGCAAAGSSVYSMTVNPLPVVMLTSSDADTTICAGDLVNFNASGAALYELFINGISQGAPSALSAYTSTTITNGQVFTVKGYSNYGCAQMSSNVFTYSVNPLPVVTLSSSDADGKLCLNQMVVFGASGASQYEFFIDGISQGAPSSSNTFSATSITNLQTVTVAGSLNGCLVNSVNSYSFNVYTYPSVNMSASLPSGAICAGQLVTFTATGANLYEFFISGISQGLTAAGVFTTTSIANGQNVSVSGINVVCPSSASQVFIYNVLNYPVTSLASSDPNNSICYGDNVTFTAGNAMQYEFFVNGISQGTVSAISSFTNSSLENNDVITVKGYNGQCGALSANTFTFHVDKMNLNLGSNSSNLICQGSSITYTASGANLYQFFVNGVSQGAPLSNNTFASGSLNDGDVITFQGTNSITGCIQPCDYQQIVSVMNTPVATVNGPTTFCQGDSVIIKSNYSIGNQWMLNGSPIANAVDSIYVAYTAGVYSTDVSQGGNGTIWSVGANINGQLGDSTLLNSFTPKVVKNITTITNIDAGNEFNIAMNSGGNVFVWGDNAYGNLGDGTFTDRNYPYQLPSVSGAVAVAAGANHALVLSGGSVKAFGNNTDGQLGIGNNGLANFPTAVAGLNGVTAISCGDKHSMALKSDGTVWTFGDNQYGQLGNGTYNDNNSPVQVVGLTNVIAISAGKYHSMALRSDSTIWVWGNNSHGQLGFSSVTFSNVAVQVPVLGKYIAVSAGGDHSLALHKNGRVYAWGDNQYGQLGDGTTTARSTPLVINNFSGIKKIKAGVYHNMASRQDLSVWSWGYNVYGQCGNGGSVNIVSPVHIDALSGAGQFAPGLNHTSVAMANQAKCNSNTVNITIIPAAPVVIYDNVTSLSTDPGVSYQWYFNNSPILNGINQTQQFIGAGYYFVQVTYANGCVVTSDQFAYMVGVRDLANEHVLQLFPNPASTEFTIDYKGTIEISEVYLTDILDKRVMTIASNIDKNNFTAVVDVNHIHNGVYMIRVVSKNRILEVKKVVINK